MPIETVAGLLDELEKTTLLNAEQVAILRHEQPRFRDPKELAKAIVLEYGWLTRYQVVHAIRGTASELFFENFLLLELIGQGGMGQVFKALHRQLQKIVAIKVIRPERLSTNSAARRFRREVKALSRLSHENVVLAYDAHEWNDTHFIVMEYVDGADLQTVVKKKGPLPFADVANYVAQAARGLQHAHEMGLIHRDVKPANVLVNSQGKVKLLDLGLALFSDDKQASLTMDYNDKVLGTADYLAPEQALNSHKVDARADIYGLGCTMYFMLTGSAPFPEGSIAQRIAKHQSAMPTDVRKLRTDCPGELEGICVKMIQKDPKFRYSSCDQVADVLDAWRAKYLAEQKRPARVGSIGGSGDSHLNLGEESNVASGRGSASSVDTVSNRSSDTEAGKSGSGTGSSKLGPGDSGILMRIAKKSETTEESSRIDLEAEIRRRAAQSTAHGQNSGAAKSDRQSAQSGTKRPTTVAATAVSKPVAKINKPIELPKSRGKLIAVIIALVAMLGIAVALGLFIFYRIA